MIWRIPNVGALGPGQSITWSFYLDYIHHHPSQKVQVIWAVPQLPTTLQITDQRMTMETPIDTMWTYSFTLTNLGSVTTAYDIVGAELS